MQGSAAGSAHSGEAHANQCCTLMCIALVLYNPEHTRTIEIGNPAVSQDLYMWQQPVWHPVHMVKASVLPLNRSSGVKMPTAPMIRALYLSPADLVIPAACHHVVFVQAVQVA